MHQVRKTNIGSPPIQIMDGGENTIDTDLDLSGRFLLEWGEQANESLLGLLENFARPETSGSTYYAATPTPLGTPITGQLWFNKTRKVLYQRSGNVWIPLVGTGDYAANWGKIVHGQTLPKPVSIGTGHVFDYSECIWSVSPALFEVRHYGFFCSINENAVVTLKYKTAPGQTIGEAAPALGNYLIVGLRGNTNLGNTTTQPFA